MRASSEPSSESKRGFEELVRLKEKTKIKINSSRVKANDTKDCEKGSSCESEQK